MSKVFQAMLLKEIPNRTPKCNLQKFDMGYAFEINSREPRRVPVWLWPFKPRRLWGFIPCVDVMARDTFIQARLRHSHDVRRRDIALLDPPLSDVEIPWNV